MVAVIDSVAEGIKWMEQHNTADLMLMDIQLSDGNCFEIFKQANVKTPIIFTTAYDNFALQAFKVNSIDYLMKPIELKELKNALTKYQQFKPVERQTIDIASIAEEFPKEKVLALLGGSTTSSFMRKQKILLTCNSSKALPMLLPTPIRNYPWIIPSTRWRNYWTGTCSFASTASLLSI